MTVSRCGINEYRSRFFAGSIYCITKRTVKIIKSPAAQLVSLRISHFYKILSERKLVYLSIDNWESQQIMLEIFKKKSKRCSNFILHLQKIEVSIPLMAAIFGLINLTLLRVKGEIVLFN